MRGGQRIGVNDALRGVQAAIVRSWLHRTSDSRSTRSVSPFYQEVSSLHPLQVGKTNLFRLTGASYLGRYLSRQRQATLANFRLRCAPLSFLRSVRDDSGCAECSWCHMGVQDEHHLIFECPSLRMVHPSWAICFVVSSEQLALFFSPVSPSLERFLQGSYDAMR